MMLRGFAVSVYLWSMGLKNYDPILTADEERELVARAQAGDQAANLVLHARFDRTIRGYAGRVWQKFGPHPSARPGDIVVKRGLELDDLISEGRLGLAEAIHRFDFGNRLASYAKPYIWGPMFNLVRSARRAGMKWMPNGIKWVELSEYDYLPGGSRYAGARVR